MISSFKTMFWSNDYRGEVDPKNDLCELKKKLLSMYFTSIKSSENKSWVNDLNNKWKTIYFKIQRNVERRTRSWHNKYYVGTRNYIFKTRIGSNISCMAQCVVIFLCRIKSRFYIFQTPFAGRTDSVPLKFVNLEKNWLLYCKKRVSWLGRHVSSYQPEKPGVAARIRLSAYEGDYHGSIKRVLPMREGRSGPKRGVRWNE